MIAIMRNVPIRGKKNNKKNELNKVNLDEVKTEILAQHYQRLNGPRWSPVGHLRLKSSKQVCLEWRNLKHCKEETAMRNLTSNLYGQQSGWLNGTRSRVPWLDPLLETQSLFTQEWVKWSGGWKEKFPKSVVPKPIGEVLTQATIRLKE